MENKFSDKDAGTGEWARVLGCSTKQVVRHCEWKEIEDAYQTEGGHWRAFLNPISLKKAFGRIEKARLESQEPWLLGPLKVDLGRREKEDVYVRCWLERVDTFWGSRMCLRIPEDEVAKLKGKKYSDGEARWLSPELKDYTGKGLSDADKKELAKLKKGSGGLSLEMKKAFEPMLLAGQTPEGEVERYLLAGAIQGAVVGQRGPSLDEACHYRWCIRQCLIEPDPVVAMKQWDKKDKVFKGLHPTEDWLMAIDEVLAGFEKGGLKLEESLSKLRGVAVSTIGLQHQEPLQPGVEAKAQEFLGCLRKWDYKEGSKDLMGMPTNKRNQIYEQLALLSKERVRLSTDKLHQKFWAILRKPKCPRRIARWVGEAWHALSPPQPAKGWGGAPRPYHLDPDGEPVDCTGYELCEKPPSVHFGWKWARATERARSFRRLFNKEERAELLQQATSLLGIRGQDNFISLAELKAKKTVDSIHLSSGSSL
jgi:hypothetical protein